MGDDKSISDEDLDRLKQTATPDEWNDLCGEIKKKYGGYPADWYTKVIQSGLILKFNS